MFMDILSDIFSKKRFVSECKSLKPDAKVALLMLVIGLLGSTAGNIFKDIYPQHREK